MGRFVWGWKKGGLESKLEAKSVAYAYDFVICCAANAEEAMGQMRTMMQRLKLTVNEAKTHIRQLPNERFDFLGYTFGRCYSRKNGRAYYGTRPSKKSLSRIRQTMHETIDRRRLWLKDEEMVERINRQLAGWANYFCLGPVSQTYQPIDHYTATRLRQWLGKKNKGG